MIFGGGLHSVFKGEVNLKKGWEKKKKEKRRRRGEGGVIQSISVGTKKIGKEGKGVKILKGFQALFGKGSNCQGGAGQEGADGEKLEQK